MSSGTRRTQRIASIIRAEIARALLEEVSDPAIQGTVITDVDLSKDLKHARVFFVTSTEPNEKQANAIQKGFHRASPFFKKKLRDNLELRNIPELRFERDRHGESLDRLMNLFNELDHPA